MCCHFLLQGIFLTQESNLSLREGPGGSVVKNLPANEGDEGLILQEDPLEKEMATHCSTLAWDTPWREETSEPQSMGL